MNKFTIIYCFSLAFLTSCSESSNETPKSVLQTDKESYEEKYKDFLFANSKIENDTIEFGKESKVKLFLTKDDYKDRYYRDRGTFIIFKNGIKYDFKTRKSSQFLIVDTLDVSEDTALYIINTNKLSDVKRGQLNTYYFETNIIVKNKTTQKDSTFSLVKHFFVKSD